MKSIYVSSFVKLPAGIPSENVYKVLDIGFVIDQDTGVIKNVSITLLTDVAIKFLSEMIIGFNLEKHELSVLTEEIKSRYHGSAQKAVIAALKNVFDKYCEIKANV
ncbi:MAG: DUF3870 domain-containing protein [Clostridia bacterium]